MIDIDKPGLVPSSDGDSSLPSEVESVEPINIQALQSKLRAARREVEIVEKRNEVLMRRCMDAETDRSSLSIALDMTKAELRLHRQYYERWQMAQQELEEAKQHHVHIVEKIESRTAGLRRSLDTLVEGAIKDYHKIKKLKAEVRQLQAEKQLGEGEHQGKEEAVCANEDRMEKDVKTECATRLDYARPSTTSVNHTSQELLHRPDTSQTQISPEIQPIDHNEAIDPAPKVRTIRLRPVPLIDVTDPRARKWMGEKDTKVDKGKSRAY